MKITINRNRALLGAALLGALAINAPQSFAQDEAKKPKDGAKKAKGDAKKPAQKGAAMAGQYKRIEDVIGKPLTDAQKKEIADAQKAYTESIAKSLGLTVDEWMAKQKEFRDKQRAAGGDKPTEKKAN